MMIKNTLMVFVIPVLFATACFAKDQIPSVKADMVESKRDISKGSVPGRSGAMIEPNAPNEAAQPLIFRSIETNKLIAPDSNELSRKYKDCKYDEKGKITNAPCTGTLKDDKGVTWWP